MSKLFTCNHCRCNTPFDSRTIRAWNLGAIKLYCSRCHSEWLRNRNSGYDNSYTASNKGSGCLGALLLILALPIGIITLTQWLS